MNKIRGRNGAPSPNPLVVFKSQAPLITNQKKEHNAPWAFWNGSIYNYGSIATWEPKGALAPAGSIKN